MKYVCLIGLRHPHYFLLAFLAALMACLPAAYAEAGCQVLDSKSSRLDLTVDIFGEQKKTKLDKIKGFLWVDPKNPEGARLVAELKPNVSGLFGKFEENPLLIGMLSNFLDQDLTFKSQSISKQGSGNQYHVQGQVTSGTKVYPSDFMISSSDIGAEQSRFSAKVQSKDFQKILGTPGSAKGDFDLIFRANPILTKERCVL